MRYHQKRKNKPRTRRKPNQFSNEQLNFSRPDENDNKPTYWKNTSVLMKNPNKPNSENPPNYTSKNFRSFLLSCHRKKKRQLSIRANVKQRYNFAALFTSHIRLRGVYRIKKHVNLFLRKKKKLRRDKRTTTKGRGEEHVENWNERNAQVN